MNNPPLHSNQSGDGINKGNIMSSKEDNINLYSEYNKALRSWLVGFGFGVPALFIVNEAAQTKLIQAGNARCIIMLFLIGATGQILLAFLNKIISWCAYRNKDANQPTANSIVRFFATAENWFWIDIVCDLISLVTFGWSIYLIVDLFTKT